MMNEATYDKLCHECKRLVREFIAEQMNFESCLGIDEGIFARHAEYEDVNLGVNFPVSPLASPFFYCSLGRQVQVYLGCLKTVVAEELLKSPGADSLLDALDGKGVPKHMRGHWLGDCCPTANLLHKPLDGANGHT